MSTENEKVLSYLETLKLFKKYGKVNNLHNAITENKSGTILIYRKGATKIQIKRYRTGRFIGILENV